MGRASSPKVGRGLPTLVQTFVEGLGLNPLTTQIESHDWQATRGLKSGDGRVDAIFQWIFHQNLVAQGSTGSSMPAQGRNPIRFENAVKRHENETKTRCA